MGYIEKLRNKNLPLLGSSRSTRLTTIESSRSVNQPFGLYHFFVCTAEAGIRKKDIKPIIRVISPSIKNSHLSSISFYCSGLSLMVYEPTSNLQVLHDQKDERLQKLTMM